MNYSSHASNAVIKSEMETDLHRAILGSEQLGHPMLTYLLRMAIEELKQDNAETTKIAAKDNASDLHLID